MKIVLFENEYKQPGDKQPDFRYSMKEGEEWLSVGAAWFGNTKTGKKMLSITLDDANLEKYLEQQKEYTGQQSKPVSTGKQTTLDTGDTNF